MPLPRVPRTRPTATVNARPDDPLKGLDLHHLECLVALVEERSVTRAARRLGVSQSGLSNALARLRAASGDPLLIQTGREMLPTERARTLAYAARTARRLIGDALAAGAPFDPQSAREDVVIAVSDYAAALVLPPLMARLGREAPGLAIRVRAADPSQAPRWLEEGECHMAITYFASLGGELHASALQTDRPWLLARRDHPIARPGLDLEAYLACDHACLGGYPGPRSTLEAKVDAALDALGRKRRVALTLPHSLVTPRVVAYSDLVATLSRHAADAFAATLPLQVLPLPFAVPDFSIELVWHERTHHLAAHAWLRGLIRGLFRQG
jgi:DNA-binding transcriptional LysR family regulator